MSAYKLQANGSVRRMSDTAFIPANPDNADWREYQVWLAKGGTPDAADPVATPEPTDDEIFRAAVVAKLQLSDADLAQATASLSVADISGKEK